VTCPDCGAEQPAGASCEQCFHALLAFEAERPEAFGAVHHLTVACYSLQHPRGYSRAALNAWRDLVSDSLDGDATVAQIRARVGQEFRDRATVREAGALPPDSWPREWRCHVQQVIRPGEDLEVREYVARARDWAHTIRAALA
jgi:hypothetical protein